MKKIIMEANSLREVSLKYFGYSNTNTYSKIRGYIEKNNMDISHYSPQKKTILYPKIIKKCPICGNEFQTQQGHPREKTVCSHSCSNTYFRSGGLHPNYKEDEKLTGKNKYVTICFRHHEKKCVYCGEKLIVEAHHYDGNKKNNKPENLVPLCPTHHRYWHSRFRYIVKSKVDEYVKGFIKRTCIPLVFETGVW